MNESEKASVRACLVVIADALHEARDVKAFWDELGSDVKMRWGDFQADVHAIRASLIPK